MLPVVALRPPGTSLPVAPRPSSEEPAVKTRPAAAGIAAAALLVGSAGIAAATSTGAPALGEAAARTSPLLRTQSADLGKNTVRLSGTDRYATSVDVSSSTWTPEDTNTVFLATGEGYADALSMGASTFSYGPLLLTRPGTLPPAVAAEIQRLKPCTIVVVGGTTAVSDAVALQADGYADSTAAKCSA